MFIARVNQSNFTIQSTAEGITVNGSPLNWDMVKISDGYFHILYQNKSYRAEVVKADYEAKVFTVKINGRSYPVEVKDKFDLLLEKLGMDDTSGSKINSVRAPMPGLIVELKVGTGDSVNPGDPLLILEAMKMENILKATGTGIVKSVKVKRGDSVEKGQVLVEF